jgi:hypothetical protein
MTVLKITYQIMFAAKETLDVLVDIWFLMQNYSLSFQLRLYFHWLVDFCCSRFNPKKDKLADQLGLPHAVRREYSIFVEFDKESRQIELALNYFKNSKSFLTIKNLICPDKQHDEQFKTLGEKCHQFKRASPFTCSKGIAAILA